MALRFQEAQAEHLASLNLLYAQVHFAPSRLPQDRTFFAVANALPLPICALGRINQYEDGALEIGGFWVHEQARGQGIARKMVSHVLHALPARRTVFCIPFAPLVPFYSSFGMRLVESACSLPRSIADKLGYCHAQRREGHYQDQPAVLVFET